MHKHPSRSCHALSLLASEKEVSLVQAWCLLCLPWSKRWWFYMFSWIWRGATKLATLAVFQADIVQQFSKEGSWWNLIWQGCNSRPTNHCFQFPAVYNKKIFFIVSSTVSLKTWKYFLVQHKWTSLLNRGHLMMMKSHWSVVS